MWMAASLAGNTRPLSHHVGIVVRADESYRIQWGLVDTYHDRFWPRSAPVPECVPEWVRFGTAWIRSLMRTRPQMQVGTNAKRLR